MTSLAQEPILPAKTKHFIPSLEAEENQSTLINSTRQLNYSLNHFQLDLRINEKVQSVLEQRLNGKRIKDEIFKDSANQTDNQKAEGPIIEANICNYVVSDKDNVDDLLSSLGF